MCNNLLFPNFVANACCNPCCDGSVSAQRVESVTNNPCGNCCFVCLPCCPYACGNVGGVTGCGNVGGTTTGCSCGNVGNANDTCGGTVAGLDEDCGCGNVGGTETTCPCGGSHRRRRCR